MRILLVGEFSGFHSTLKSGLTSLGNDVTLASTGDAWKKFDRDISILPDFENKNFEKIFRYFLPCINLKQLLGYDIVQFVNPAILSVINPFNAMMGRRIAKHSGKTFLSACGDDAFYLAGLKNLRYNPLEDAKAIDYRGHKMPVEYSWAQAWNRELAGMVNGIIPVMFDYAQAYRGHPDLNVRRTIPLPVNLEQLKYVGCNANKSAKIRVFHGLNREGFKGTRYVREAFAILKKRYSDCAEFIIGGHIPYNSYINYLSGFDIVVDQVNSYSCGLNGIIAMALGKVVVGGAEPESIIELGVPQSPVINITPNVADIVEKISTLIDARLKLESIGYESRIFAENHHDHIKISKKYLSEWLL